MVGWHHRLNGHEFEQTLGGSEGQGSLACCSPRGHKEMDTNERLNNDNKCKTEQHTCGISIKIQQVLYQSKYKMFPGVFFFFPPKCYKQCYNVCICGY